MDIENNKNPKNLAQIINKASSISGGKAEALTQVLQTKGVEVQSKVEYEVSLALDNYLVAIKNLRRSLFVESKDVKQKIIKSRKEAHARRRAEIQELKSIIKSDVKKTEIQFQITTSSDFPLRTRHYIPAIVNVRVDASSTYPLFNLCAFQEVSKGMNEAIQKSLIRPQLKTITEKEIKQIDQHKVNFVCEYLANKVSSHYMTMVILARMINKPPTSLTKFWFRLTKKPIQKTQNKIFAYKNAQYFCTVCCKYVCNLHYEEAVDDPTTTQNTDPDFEYTPYVTRYLVAYGKDYKEEEDKTTQKKKIDEEDLKDKYHLLYKCPQKMQKDCYLFKGRSMDEVKNFNVASFQENEREYILNYCLRYGLTNPCTIRLFLNNNKKCWEIETFINKNPFIPRNISPGDLIAQAKSDKRYDNKAKKKKNEAVSQIWKHYVPCYHPGQACGDRCACREIGNCEIFCGCPKDCPLRFSGCNCKPGRCTESGNCPCLKNNRECDPELCRSCNSDLDIRMVRKRKLKTVACPNTVILYKCKPRLLLGKSSICDGMGIYAGQNFEKGDFIGEYVGEMIEYIEGDYRGVIYNDLGCSYMFDYEEEMTLDSYFYGNKLRFVNHGYLGMENSETKYKLVKGTVHIGLYAARNIKIGDEILFNYGENYQLDWLLDYNEKVKKQKMEEDKKKKLKKKKVIDLFKETKPLEEVIFSELEDD